MTYPGATVVVGCDGSWQSEAAVALGAHEAARRGVELVLLSVAYAKPGPASLSALVQRESEALQIAVAWGKRAALHARREEPTVPVRIVAARRADGPDVMGEASRAVLLVLGQHGSHGQTVFSMGSASGELARLFPCPLLVTNAEWPARGRPAQVREPRVVAGLSGSDADEAVLGVATEEAALRQCGLVALRVLSERQAAERDGLRSARDRSRTALRQVEGALQIPTRVVVAVGAPVEILASHVGPADLLVIGTRGGGRLAGLVSGSAAREVLDAMPCDVLVVPPGLAPGVWHGEPVPSASR